MLLTIKYRHKYNEIFTCTVQHNVKKVMLNSRSVFQLILCLILDCAWCFNATGSFCYDFMKLLTL